MELTKQVCCLDFAKQLKELGVKQESCFGWYEGFKGSWFVGDMADVMNHATATARMITIQVFMISVRCSYCFAIFPVPCHGVILGHQRRTWAQNSLYSSPNLPRSVGSS